MSDEPETPDGEEEDTRRGMDDELKAIAAIMRILARQPDGARQRIVRYCTDRFQTEGL